jgi:hypothetical protein
MINHNLSNIFHVLHKFSVNASCRVNYINLFIETVTTQRFNEIT